MQTTLYRIWTRTTKLISYDDNFLCYEHLQNQLYSYNLFIDLKKFFLYVSTIARLPWFFLFKTIFLSEDLFIDITRIIKIFLSIQ